MRAIDGKKTSWDVCLFEKMICEEICGIYLFVVTKNTNKRTLFVHFALYWVLQCAIHICVIH